jgi:hypothetical protein
MESDPRASPGGGGAVGGGTVPGAAMSRLTRYLAVVAVTAGVAASAAASLVGCFETPKPNCSFACGPGNTCPDDYACQPDGICHLMRPGGRIAECDVPILDAPAADAPSPPADARPAVDADETPDADLGTDAAPSFDATVDATPTFDATVDASEEPDATK